MAQHRTKSVQAAPAINKPFVVRLPGFVADEPVGLGDVVTRIGAHMGLRACGGCERRATAMNHWMIFSGPRNG